jgi:hypothetical protein
MKALSHSGTHGLRPYDLDDILDAHGMGMPEMASRVGLC